MKYTIEVTELKSLYRLTKDKVARKLESNEILEVDLLFDDYQSAENVAESIKNLQIDGEKIEFDSSIYTLGKPSLVINRYRINEPKQKYFSKEELHNVLKAGDDSRNNALIIDFDGYVKLADLDEAKIKSAVRFETFAVGNGYVGGTWDEEQLNSLYETMLQGWYRHLNTGSDVYVDYHDGTSESDIIENIEKMLLK